MGELIAQIWTPQVQFLAVSTIIFFVCLYALSVVWVARDAYARGCYWIPWTLVALIPLLGVIAYCLLRPSLYVDDSQAQDVAYELQKRQLMQYGMCPQCSQPINDTFIVCPFCAAPLKRVCTQCAKPLDTSWKLCPYCATPCADDDSSVCADNASDNVHDDVSENSDDSAQ